ncbi:MAG: gamma-aminobutyrate dehydratase [Candidatus Abyssubacteria bacterium]|nr:gamma-aminobutyrate dehydratase [Candidatus Abyssubacteria bacterium]
MALRTPDEYRESLRDGRRVYLLGEKVEDVTAHPLLKVAVETVAQDFVLSESEDPDVQNLFVAEDEETGEPISRFFKTPKTIEDLENRSRMIGESIRLTGGLPFGKDVGTDCLNAVTVVADQMGVREYVERAKDYLRHIRKNDLAMCGAVTDAKGDRSKPPSKQEHPDYYVRVVDKQKDGIVVNGCKLHITSAPVANDIIVTPTRQMRENEGDYALSFAIPINTEGITMICRPGRGERSPHEFPQEHPVRALSEAMVVFDNVFVPWERVFMCGEWQFSMLLAYTFASFHRFTAISYKIPIVEAMAGIGVAMAEANGIERVGHVRGKLADMAAYVETLKALTRAAAKDPVMYGEIAVPNPLIANMAKLHFANGYHNFVQLIQDVSGGIITTAPTYKDWTNPETREYMEHYLGGSVRYTTEQRLRLTEAAHRLVASAEHAHLEVTTVHAEGSMEAQKMMILFEAPLAEYAAMAKRMAGVED